jgi:hypothetical protein
MLYLPLTHDPKLLVDHFAKLSIKRLDEQAAETVWIAAVAATPIKIESRIGDITMIINSSKEGPIKQSISSNRDPKSIQ